MRWKKHTKENRAMVTIESSHDKPRPQILNLQEATWSMSTKAAGILQIGVCIGTDD